MYYIPIRLYISYRLSAFNCINIEKVFFIKLKRFIVMKLNYLPIFILLQLLSVALLGNEVSYNAEAPLIDHLISINKEWTKQKDIPTHLMTIPIKFNSDEERIQLHLQLVEKTLKARSADHLTIQQFINRKKNLESLVDYWKEGQFPINTRHAHRQPYFIDDFGTACAVGHLLLTSGEEDLAQHISDVQNYAFIHEMNYSKLNDWASENGFTKDELAWIQPTYQDYSLCHTPEAIEGLPEYDNSQQPLSQQGIETFMTMPDESVILVGGSFLHYDATDGVHTASIFGYDGENYISFGDAIQGTVYDIEYHNGHIYAAGDFVLAGTDFYNIAYWNGTAWVGIQTGDMGGTIRDIASYECQLYVGGDFLSVDANDIANLVVWNGTSWSTTPQDCMGQSAEEALEVNGAVNAFEIYHNKLVIGGDFTQVDNKASSAEGLLFWENLAIERLPSNSGITSVNNLQAYESALIIGADQLYVYRWNKWYYPGDTIRQPELSIPSYYGNWTIPAVTNIHDIFYNPPIVPEDNYFFEFSNLVISAGNKTHAINSKFYGGGFSFYITDYVLTVSGKISAIGQFKDTPFYGGNFNAVTVQKGNYSYIYPNYNCQTYYSAEKIFAMDMWFPLPVELSEFAVTSTDNSTAHLKWTSLTETNSSHYEIERKADNQDFTRIGIVNAAGESLEEINYTFEDDISTLTGGHIYYRLKMVDKDSSFEYSDVRSLKLRSSGSTVSVYPNPAEDVLAISLDMPWTGDLAVNIYNLNGQLVNTYQWTYDTTLAVREQIDISDLQNGLYLVEVVTPKERITKKLDIIK